MNILEKYLETFIYDSKIDLSQHNLTFTNSYLSLSFRRNWNSNVIMLDGTWIENDGTKYPHYNLRGDIPANTIYEFLTKYTNSTPELKHYLLEKSTQTNNKNVVLKVFDKFFKEVEDNKFPVFKLAPLHQKLELELLKNQSNQIQKLKI